MDRAILSIILSLIVFEEAIDRIWVLGEEVDGLYFVELLADEREFLDGCDSVIDELHHFHKTAQNFEGRLVSNEDEGHGVGL